MKPAASILALCIAFSCATTPLPLRAEPEPDPDPAPAIKPVRGDLSLKLEVERAIEKGLAWLQTQQDKDTGAWGDPKHPALTALPLCAMLGSPALDRAEPLPPPLRAAFQSLLDRQKPDGGVYVESLSTYNTSLSLLALSLAADPAFDPPILAARRFLVGQQADYGEKNITDDPFDGGIGYGGTYTHSDLSNTHFALEALHYSRKALADSAADPKDDPSASLNWDAAIRFVERCQNLTASNDQEWASDDPDNRGGFVYFPGNSKAGLSVLKDGRKTPRSYGSMSYAGLLSFIYAEMDQSDPRVIAALDWLKAHYSVEENPGMEHEGLFYYYHTMAKALSLSSIDTLELNNGATADWKLDLSRKLFDLQRLDGSWINDTGRWWEKDPVLVTAYAVLTLEHIHRSL